MILFYAIVIDEDGREHVSLHKTSDEAWQAIYDMFDELYSIRVSSPEELEEKARKDHFAAYANYYVDEVLVPA